MTPENHVGLQAPSNDLTGLILEYIRLSRLFDASNIYDADLNIPFGRLNYIEQLILSKDSKNHKLFAHFLSAKANIDLLMNGVQVPSEASVEPNVKAHVAPVIESYKVKEDHNKKKYRSVLTITRTDTTGFEAMRMREGIKKELQLL
jgi:hypothetical protein